MRKVSTYSLSTSLYLIGWVKAKDSLKWKNEDGHVLNLERQKGGGVRATVPSMGVDMLIEEPGRMAAAKICLLLIAQSYDD